MPSHEDFQVGGTLGSILDSRDSLKRELNLDLALEEFRQSLLETLDNFKLELMALFEFDSTFSVESEQPNAIAEGSSFESEQPDAVADDFLQERLDALPARMVLSTKLPLVAYRERMVTSQKGAVIVVGGFPIFVEASCFPNWHFLFPSYLVESLVPDILQLQVYVIACLRYYSLKMSRIKWSNIASIDCNFC